MKARRFLWIIALLAPVTLVACGTNNRERTNTGNALYESGNYDAAERAYQAAQVAAPDRPEAYINLASTLLARGDHGEAIATLEQALKTANDEQAALAYYNLGNVFFEMGRYEDAIEAYQQTLLRDPADEDARYNLELAWSYLQLPTPTALEQQTEPEESQANTTATPTNNPAGRDDPSPTPPLEEGTPDLSATPIEPVNSERGTIEAGTPLPREGGSMTVEEARRLLDDSQRDQKTLREYLQQLATPEAQSGKDW